VRRLRAGTPRPSGPSPGRREAPRPTGGLLALHWAERTPSPGALPPHALRSAPPAGPPARVAPEARGTPSRPGARPPRRRKQTDLPHRRCPIPAARERGFRLAGAAPPGVPRSAPSIRVSAPAAVPASPPAADGTRSGTLSTPSPFTGPLPTPAAARPRPGRPGRHAPDHPRRRVTQGAPPLQGGCAAARLPPDAEVAPGAGSDPSFPAARWPCDADATLREPSACPPRRAPRPRLQTRGAPPGRPRRRAPRPRLQTRGAPPGRPPRRAPRPRLQTRGARLGGLPGALRGRAP
jgi:hypothetical protein